mgnify:CR=1 FL=1|tara:strand:- start:9328 stop:9555 length:228 start_codon:yes stop_codon:yes gene_type:complete
MILPTIRFKVALVSPSALSAEHYCLAQFHIGHMILRMAYIMLYAKDVPSGFVGMHPILKSMPTITVEENNRVIFT